MNAIFSRDTFMRRADIFRPPAREMVLGGDDRRLLEDVVGIGRNARTLG
jgi:hypothetical protein